MQPPLASRHTWHAPGCKKSHKIFHSPSLARACRLHCYSSQPLANHLKLTMLHDGGRLHRNTCTPHPHVLWITAHAKPSFQVGAPCETSLRPSAPPPLKLRPHIGLDMTLGQAQLWTQTHRKGRLHQAMPWTDMVYGTIQDDLNQKPPLPLRRRSCSPVSACPCTLQSNSRADANSLRMVWKTSPGTFCPAAAEAVPSCKQKRWRDRLLLALKHPSPRKPTQTAAPAEPYQALMQSTI